MAKSLSHWIDELLMALFFLSVGLEIKRELLVGVLSSTKQAVLPVAAAMGGMLFPALIYAAFNVGRDSISGWGIPMATDIAFSIAILGLLGRRAPFSLKVFLTALAIADDLGAVLVIALFYTPGISWIYLAYAVIFLGLLTMANRIWIRRPLGYALLGLGLWFCILGSGIHATVAGVLVAFFIPAKSRYDTDAFLQRVEAQTQRFDCGVNGCGHSVVLDRSHLAAVQEIAVACENVEPPLQRLEHALHPWITFVVLPLFALAHTGLYLQGVDLATALYHPITIGIFFGLALGKPLGISLFTLAAVKILKTPLSPGLHWPHIVSAGLLGGIGFTMSLFISNLSFARPEELEFAKLGIITASVLCGITGFALLRFLRPADKVFDG
jgi:NhaA family Na+:H+ antiporter